MRVFPFMTQKTISTAGCLLALRSLLGGFGRVSCPNQGEFHNPTRQRGNVAECFPSLTRRVEMHTANYARTRAVAVIGSKLHDVRSERVEEGTIHWAITGLAHWARSLGELALHGQE